MQNPANEIMATGIKLNITYSLFFNRTIARQFRLLIIILSFNDRQSTPIYLPILFDGSNNSFVVFESE